MRRISVLGSTGSIGTQTLQVVALHPDRFEVKALTGHGNAQLLYQQVRQFRPELAVLAEKPEDMPEDVKFCRWAFGEEGLLEAAQLSGADDVLVSVTGFAGLKLSMAAAQAGKRLLLANKESLVAGGALLTKTVKEPILPVDSEHSAIFQCLQGAGGNVPSRLILTASGGPFRTWEKDKIYHATVAQALNHPNWSMGKKITVDSASMLNKALEVIEAYWLYGLPGEKIDVLIHPQSIVHSMVEFEDGSVMAQLGVPDMRIPILYAMAYPERLESGVRRLDLAQAATLNFEKPDDEKFPGLKLAYQAIKAGKTAGAALNAANEAAVEAFLAGRMPFGRISEVVEKTLQTTWDGDENSLEGILASDERARREAWRVIEAL